MERMSRPYRFGRALVRVVAVLVAAGVALAGAAGSIYLATLIGG